MAFTFNPFTGKLDVIPAPAEDLNTSNLRFEYQTSFPIGFTTNARLYGQYLYVLAATNQLAIIDVSNPFGPFLAGNITGSASHFSLRQSGNYLFTFETNRLRVYDISNPATASLLYGPTAAAGNVRSSSDGDVAGSYVYTYKPSTTEFHVIDVADPLIPIEVSTISTTTFSNLAHTHAYDNDVVYSSANGVLQAYDVSNPESLVLLSSLTLTGLSTSIDRIYSIKPLGSFLYCSARITTTNQPALLILNKTNPAAMTEESITPLGTSGVSLVTLTPNLELFFPFAAINYYFDGTSSNIEFYDIRQYDAPEFKQDFASGSTGFQFSVIGNNYYEVSFAGVDAYILFGTNVSNAVVGTVQAGTVAAYGEVTAGKVNIRGDLACRNDGWFQNKLNGREITAQEELNAYHYRNVLRYMMMMGD